MSAAIGGFIVGIVAYSLIWLNILTGLIVGHNQVIEAFEKAIRKRGESENQ